MRLFVVVLSWFMLIRTTFAFVSSQQRRDMIRALFSAAAATDFQEGNVSVPRGDDQYSLYYRIYNPNCQKTPLVVIHGGPSLPSQYLYPITKLMDNDRPIVFYDQLGCGKSDEPSDLECYSIAQSVDDLQHLLKKLSFKKVHLLGHSYGGNVAFEFAVKYSHNIASLILANTSTDMKYTYEEYDRLQQENSLFFWNQHVCRTWKTPRALQNAFRHSGTVWSGMHVVIDYKATTPTEKDMPPTLIVLGKHDFGAAAQQNWNEILPKSEQVVLENCAHYPFYEDGHAFGEAVNDFMERHDG